MAEIAAGMKVPTPFETSIEIPFRLILSPAQDAAWRTPLGLPRRVPFRAASDTARSGPVPLWFAQLDDLPGSSSLRAVWSPDFRPEALLDATLGGPQGGGWAPWAMPREVSERDQYKPKEPTYPKPGQQPGEKDPERFRAGLDANDRHQLVALTSLHGLPVRGRVNKDGTIAPNGSQFAPPPGFRVRDAIKESLEEGGPAEDRSAIYRSQPIGVGELTLTALGGSFDSDTAFVPPASARIKLRGGGSEGQDLFKAFSIERWRQDTRLGRDIHVDVVAKGFWFPCGHRVSFITVTERRFVARGPDRIFDGPVAFLVQRQFLRCGPPAKGYPALAQPEGGRRWPVEQLEILTRDTPDILNPRDDQQPSTGIEGKNGRLFLGQGDQLVFWPRVRQGRGGEVKLEMQIDSRGGRTRMPLIFVQYDAANNQETMRALTEYYNALKSGDEPDPRRVLWLGGGKRRYAPETEPDGTSFETERWEIGAEGRQNAAPTLRDDGGFTFHNINFDFGPLLQGVDQPPFYPTMSKGSVRIAQVDRLVGRQTDLIQVFF